MEKSMVKHFNDGKTDGSEKNGGFKNTKNPLPRPPVTPPPQKPQKKLRISATLEHLLRKHLNGKTVYLNAYYAILEHQNAGI